MNVGLSNTPGASPRGVPPAFPNADEFMTLWAACNGAAVYSSLRGSVNESFSRFDFKWEFPE